MRFESDAMVLWFGTADAPAPSGALPPEQSGLPINVAVQPPSISNTVQIIYRVNGGAPMPPVTAALKRQDVVQKVQYFLAQLPANTFKPGDKVDYVAVARSPGRQVPAQAVVSSLPGSFTLAGAPTAGATGASTTAGTTTAGATTSTTAQTAASAKSPKAPPATGTVAGKGPFKVWGYLFYEHGLPATGITTRLYARGFGGTATKLGEIVTDVNGWYAIAYDIKGPQAHIEVRAVDHAGREISLCNTKPLSGAVEKLSLVAPDSLWPPEPEFTRIAAAVGGEIGDLKKLTTCREDEEQKDLTILSTHTQWDARLIGLLASAHKIASDSRTAPDLIYGLLRAGLPADSSHLARVRIPQLETALTEAAQANIVGLSAQQMTAAKSALHAFQLSTLRASQPPGGVSSYEELLSTSGLTGAQQAAFAELFFSHEGEPADLWPKVAALGIPPEKIDTLKLQGRLFQLTLNNARLTVALQKEIGTLANLARLVDTDLHDSTGWKTRLQQLAGNNDKTLATLIPSSYGADRAEDRLEAYCADLARRVRTSFPAHVTARMLESGRFSIPGQQDGARAALAKFLKRAADLGYRMGETPVETFLRDHAKELTAGLSDADLLSIKSQLKHLHRLHQLTPSDESLKGLLDSGLKSAHDIVRIPLDSFVRRFAHRFPDGEAELIYRRAEQVHSATFGISGIVQKANNSSAGFALAAPPSQRQASQSKLIEHFPTMGSLFGSLDFCECEDCRSVLGPAAYLVDILQLLDRSKPDWEHFLESWKSSHYGAAYPYHDPAEVQQASRGSGGSAPGRHPNPQATPYEVLIQRRPDLPQLPLTCENTNTVMPYIDIANEILESFVAHDALTASSGHDTGKTRSEELLAEPQNTLPLAYDKLRSSLYPLCLPFDLWHESTRSFLRHVDSSFAEVLEIFRPTDNLFSDPKNPTQYAYADVFRETLGLSPAQFAMFADPAILTQWFKLYGYNNEGEALRELASAKCLADRLDISYVELATVIGTGFVNPSLEAMGLLWTLGIDVDEFIAAETAANAGQGFADRLAHKAEQLGLGITPAQVRTWLNDVRSQGDSGRLLYLAAPSEGSCDFGATTVRSVGGAAVDAATLLRINLFVRLRSALGWPVATLDVALQALLPKSAQPLTPANAAAALSSALIYAAHVKCLQQRLDLPERAIQRILPLWTPLPTSGRDSLYSELLLRPSILKSDAAFADPFGNYLFNSTELITSHLTTLQAALGLTARDAQGVLTDCGQDPATATLSLDNVSALYRYAFLAKALKLPVSDLIVLKALAALNPFAPLAAAPITQIADDIPYSQTLKLVDVAREIKASGFAIEDLNYLCNHQFDPVGKYRDKPLEFLGFVKTLAAGLRAIQAAQALPADLGTLSSDILQQKVALIMSANDTTTFMGLWNGTLKQQVAVAGIAPASALDPKTVSAFPELTLAYDPVTQSQGLTCIGGLADQRATQMQAANTSPSFAALIARVLAAQKAFFDRALSPFLSSNDFQQILSGADGRLAALAAKLFPYLQQQLCWQSAIQTLASNLDADVGLVSALLLHPNMLCDPTLPGVPLAATFTDVARNQLDNIAASSATSATAPASEVHLQGYIEVPATGPYRFYAQSDKAGANVTLQIDGTPVPVLTGTVSSDGGEIDGMIVLKAATLYLLKVDATHLAGGALNVLVQGETLPKDVISRLSLYSRQALDRAARAHSLLRKSLLLIDGFALKEREWRYLLVEPTATPAAGLSLCQLPADTSDVTATSAASLLQRFLNLATYARLRNDLAGGGDDLIGLFETAQGLSPPAQNNTGSNIAGSNNVSLGNASPNTASSNNANASSVSPNGPTQPPDLMSNLAARIATLTRRETATVVGALQQLGMTATATATATGGTTATVPALCNALGLDKLWRLLRFLQKLGADASVVASWATAAPDVTVSQMIRNALKAHYGPERWLVVAPSIFDRLRRLKRDALVAFIMHSNEFQSRDQLFEYFLVDPGMEPVVQTSRLRLAMSCVQTFIQRCLLNLEPAVQPAALDADQWQWMKRYRVWQACREIFLHPENYLEMEFRDDKTDLFQELEGALLQGDVTADLVEDALFQYLQKLEGIAHLEVVTLCAQENPDDPAATTLHVIARTRVSPHNYFYRRYVDEMWTAWEAVTAKVAGDHIVAVVWQNRLNIFWLDFINQAKAGSQDGGASTDSGSDGDEPELAKAKLSDMKRATAAGLPPKYIQLQLNWAEYYQGKWSTPSTSSGSDDSGSGGSGGDDSGGDGPPPGTVGTPVTVIVDANFDPTEVTVHAGVDLHKDPQAACVSVTFPDVQYIPAYHHPAEARRGKKKKHGLRFVAAPQPRPEYRPKTFTFRVVSKHSPPVFATGNPQDPPPFPELTAATTHFIGTRTFQVQYTESLQSVDGRPPTATLSRQNILQRQGKDAGATHSLTILGTALQAQQPEIGTLISPFFYADSQNSFFVEPTLTETTLDKWEHWAIPIPRADSHGAGAGPHVVAAFPQYAHPKSLPKGVSPFDGTFDSASRFKVNIQTDSVTDNAAVLHFGGTRIGTEGGSGASAPRTAAKPAARPAARPAAGKTVRS